MDGMLLSSSSSSADKANNRGASSSSSSAPKSGVGGASSCPLHRPPTVVGNGDGAGGNSGKRQQGKGIFLKKVNVSPTKLPFLIFSGEQRQLKGILKNRQSSGGGRSSTEALENV